MDYLIIFLSAALSIMLPVAIIAVRQTVKVQRQNLINDLEAMIEPVAERSKEITASFEFVKFKYFIAEANPPKGAGPKDFSIFVFTIASIPLIVTLFCLGIVAFEEILFLIIEKYERPKYIPTFVRDQPEVSVLIVAYLASYLFIVRGLLRAVSNFDLTPTTLLAGAVHVLFGAVTAVVIAKAAGSALPSAVTTTGLIVAAFAVGFMPELGLRAILRASQLWQFKRENLMVYRAFKASPIEIIDGIDSEVRSRLAQSNIVSVQNLATANPIMLFVETPYGMYQIIDWVAQAQLCTALGSNAVTEFWKLGIRTIFDLEYGVLGRTSTPELRHEIGKILIARRQPDEQDRLGLGAKSQPSSESNQTVVAMVEIIVDDLHVHRLRQIRNRMADRLGKENLPPPADAKPVIRTCIGAELV